MSEVVDISGLDKADVLAALYNHSKSQGMGLLWSTPEDMGHEEAAQLLNQNSYFDYLNGRVMKVNLGGSTLDTWGYDRDNGDGAARRAIFGK